MVTLEIIYQFLLIFKFSEAILLVFVIILTKPAILHYFVYYNVLLRYHVFTLSCYAIMLYGIIMQDVNPTDALPC
jgi:hypothetical protein